MGSIQRTDLHQVGLKVTTPRLRILHLLEESKQHLRAEDLYRTLAETGDEVGLATVYRVLTQFAEAGIVKKHHFSDDHAVFEIDHGGHHDHLVCVKCGRVEEFFDPEIEARQDDIAKRLGYEITDHSLHIYGICPNCKKK